MSDLLGTLLVKSLFLWDFLLWLGWVFLLFLGGPEGLSVGGGTREGGVAGISELWKGYFFIIQWTFLVLKVSPPCASCKIMSMLKDAFG